MKRFEYLTRREPISKEELNMIGVAGWELVSIYKDSAFTNFVFKREIL